MRSFGHQGRFQRRSLFLMNHVCHFDWLFFWWVVERQGSLCHWKSVTKDMIKKAPFLGEAAGGVYCLEVGVWLSSA